MGTNIGRTAKIEITTEGLGGTKPFLSRSNFVTRHLVEFCILVKNFEKEWPHLKKNNLETSILNEYTRKIELNSIDF